MALPAFFHRSPLVAVVEAVLAAAVAFDMRPSTGVTGLLKQSGGRVATVARAGTSGAAGTAATEVEVLRAARAAAS